MCAGICVIDRLARLKGTSVMKIRKEKLEQQVAYLVEQVSHETRGKVLITAEQKQMRH